MNKADILGHLRAAKAAHINWVQRAKLLISGFDVNEESIPVNSTECKFGKWFYGEGQLLQSIRNNPMDCMQKIEQLHFELHDVYLNIFKIYYDAGKKSFFSKLFGSKKKVSVEDQQKAQEYFKEMEAISKKLIEEINLMERRIAVISEKEIEELV
jgi:hypothetical protein